MGKENKKCPKCSRPLYEFEGVEYCDSCLSGKGKSVWISIKEKTPPTSIEKELPFVIALHSVYGVGVAWFWKFQDGDGIKEELEEEFEDKYLCSCHFIKNTVDGNDCIDEEDDIDIFENDPHFPNLGTVTHWMPLPDAPNIE
jgi:hypothetical protein